MSWRGEKGGVKAARSGHDAIMVPSSYLYLDYYQADPKTQPAGIGGFVPYLHTYSYNPIPQGLTPEEAKHIWGVQANLWTEYVKTEAHVEYMVFPRMLALAEVAWSKPENKDREDFKRRVHAHLQWLTARGVNAFTLSDRVDMTMRVDTVNQQIEVTLDNEKYKTKIYYTTDGTDPDSTSTLYTVPFRITDSVHLKAVVYDNGQKGEVQAYRLDYHKAIGKSVTLKNKYSASYPASGAATLTDGYRGGLTYKDNMWLGFLQDVEATIDMGEVTDIHSLSVKFMQLAGPDAYMPHYVTFSLSDDGVRFKEVARIENDIPANKPDLFFKDFTASINERGRYITVYAKKQSGFMFVDEIVVY
jgi:hexosaminidase